MDVFISWSKPRAKKLAVALHGWLPDVIQAAVPFMSDKDIAAGADWSGTIHERLQVAGFGIVCVTAENQLEPWLNYETGALVNAEKKPLICPLLFGLRASDLTGPMKKFQSKEATEGGILSLLKSINAIVPDGLRLDETRLERVFSKSWEELRSKIAAIESSSFQVPTQRSPDEMIGETLDTVRELARQLSVLQPMPSQLAQLQAIVGGDFSDALAKAAGNRWLNESHRRNEGLHAKGVDFTAELAWSPSQPMFTIGDEVAYNGLHWTVVDALLNNRNSAQHGDFLYVLTNKVDSNHQEIADQRSLRKLLRVVKPGTDRPENERS